MIERPPFCQDPRCQPVTYSPDAVGARATEYGPSAFCVGLLPEPVVRQEGDVEHVNDGHFCFRSPRGVAMFEVNKTDMDLFARLALRSIVAREPDARFNWRWYTGRASDSNQDSESA